MKPSKAAPQLSAQDECGVWLDATQLKGKVKQKRLARPISKLLNPFTKGEGYNLAVALNFTQTKMEMPKTKQSSISMFFAPHRRVLHKMCTSELPNLDPVCPSSSSTSGGPGVKKRGRDVGLCDSGVDCDENVTETEAALPQNQGGHHLPLLNCESEDKGSEEWKPPQSKRRLTEASLLLHDSQLPLQAWSQDPLFTCSQFPKREFNLTEKKNLDNSGRSFLDSQQSEEAFESLTDVEGRVTQTPDKNHPQIEDEKENSRSISFNSPTKRPSSSHLGLLPGQKWTEPKSAPTLKRPAGGRSGAGKEARFDSTWNKLSSSPLRKPQQRHRKVEEDSWAALFTQDSEGYRVIAHRGLLPRSPLRDQSNLSTAGLRSCAYKSVDEEEEEDEMLFTQDSQGNVVIKH